VHVIPAKAGIQTTRRSTVLPDLLRSYYLAYWALLLFFRISYIVKVVWNLLSQMMILVTGGLNGQGKNHGGQEGKQ